MNAAWRESAKLARARDAADAEARQVMQDAAAALTRGIHARITLLHKALEGAAGTDWNVWSRFHQKPDCALHQDSKRHGCVTVSVSRRTPQYTSPPVSSTICSCGPERILQVEAADGRMHKTNPEALVPFAQALTTATTEGVVEAFLEAVRCDSQAAQKFLAESKARAAAAGEAGRGVLAANSFAARVREAA